MLEYAPRHTLSNDIDNSGRSCDFIAKKPKKALKKAAVISVVYVDFLAFKVTYIASIPTFCIFLETQQVTAHGYVRLYVYA